MADVRWMLLSRQNTVPQRILLGGESMMGYKVLIVDDEPLARRGIRARLRSFRDLVVVDDCQDGLEAISSIKRHRPDLVFLDVQMPGLDGFGVLKRLPRDQRPFVIFLTAHDQYALRAFEVDAV